jgi:hypothetical protein
MEGSISFVHRSNSVSYPNVSPPLLRTVPTRSAVSEFLPLRVCATRSVTHINAAIEATPVTAAILSANSRRIGCSVATIAKASLDLMVSLRLGRPLNNLSRITNFYDLYDALRFAAEPPAISPWTWFDAIRGGILSFWKT